MGSWNIRRRGGHLELEHRRRGTLGVFRCGSLHAWTSTADILAWIIEQDATTSLDVVRLPDGDALVFLPCAPGEN